VPIDRWFETIVMPVKREPNASQPDLVLMTFHDLTPLRRVEEMRADFVANASHELRTPLARFTGLHRDFAGLGARRCQGARERFLAIMQEQARRMARLIDDLLSLSRIELNAHRRPDTPVDLVPIVRQVVDGLETLARDRGVTVNIEAANALTVLGDRDELVRIFENLVENALKYGAAGKRVDIKLGLATVRRRRARGPGQRARLRAGHRAGASAAADRALLSRRCHRKPRPGRNRAWPRARQAHSQPPSRPLTIESAPGAGATFTIHLPTEVLRH
jgi:two-component system phosphate regulon sensor histidine kinase PhoR